MMQFGVDGEIRFIQRGWANANMVLVAGERPALIDVGHFGYFDETRRLIEAQGVAAERIEQIFLTHSHWDHSSGANMLREISGARVGMNALTAQWMREGAAREMWTSYFGVEAPLISADFTTSPNDHIELSGIEWQVIGLPGHAPDLVGLYQADHKLLISADALLPNGDCGIINVAVHGWEALDAAETSAKVIANLEVDVVLPGHGPLITEVESNVTKLIKRLQRFRTEPERLATHLSRRIIMALALELPPIREAELIEMCVSAEMVVDYAPIANMQPQAFVQQAVTALLRSGALRAENGKLVSQVPR